MAVFEENAKEFNVGMGENIVINSADIDDNTVSSESTWSSKNIVDKLCPPISAIGSIVTCEPLEGTQLDVITHVPGVVAGETVTLRQVGKNLLPHPYLDGSKVQGGMTYTMQNDGGVKAEGTAIANATYYFIRELTLPPGTYTYSVSGEYTVVGAPFAYVYSETKGGVIASFGLSKQRQVTFTTDKQYNDIRVYIYSEASSFFYGTIYPQIEVGKISTDFEQYRCIENTIELPTAHFGGTYNWTTGVVTESDGKTTQLSPNDITAYPGVNTFWSSDGETEVKGYADMRVVLNKLTNAIISLGGNV